MADSKAAHHGKAHQGMWTRKLYPWSFLPSLQTDTLESLLSQQFLDAFLTFRSNLVNLVTFSDPCKFHETPESFWASMSLPGKIKKKNYTLTIYTLCYKKKYSYTFLYTILLDSYILAKKNNKGTQYRRTFIVIHIIKS